MQQPEDVARRMSGGQHHGFGGEFIGAVDHHAVDAPVAGEQVGDAAVEAHLATGGGDRLAHGGDDRRQFVGADVRMGVHQDLRAGAVGHEGAQHALHVAALVAARVELAVAVRAGAALAEAVVAVGVHDVFAVDGGQVAAARTNVLAAFDDDGFQAVADQAQRREQPGGATAHHDHRPRGGDIGQHRWQQRLLGDHGGLHPHAQAHTRLFAPRIDRAAQHLVPGGVRHACGLGSGGPHQYGVGGLQRGEHDVDDGHCGRVEGWKEGRVEGRKGGRRKGGRRKDGRVEGGRTEGGRTEGRKGGRMSRPEKG